MSPGSLRILMKAALVGAALVCMPVLSLAASAPQVSISNIPMTLVQPTPPQVLLAVTNSQSMDGDLSGAIMTGSGAVSGFSGPSSPQCYTVPSGFTPPKAAAGSNGCPAGEAPYTYVSSGGTQYDNGASRLNVAKQALTAVIKQYATSFDLGLMDYKTSGTSLYSTWVYYMSPPGGFTFTNNNQDPLPGGATQWITNPCYGSSDTTDCSSIAKASGQNLAAITSDQYMSVAATSDQPDINDVLYAHNYPKIFEVYGGPNPSSPYPPNFTLSDYNNGTIYLSYNHRTPGYGGFGPGFGTSPTNAGYVPYSPQSMDARRGFGYYVTSVNAKQGKLLVPIKDAAANNMTASQYEAQFSPYLKPETNKPSSTEIKALAYQSPIAGILKGAYHYYTGKNAPQSPNGCTAKKYVVLVTDGLPTMDLDGKNWPPLGSAAAVGYDVHAEFNLVGGGTISTTASNFKAEVLAGHTLGLVTSGTNDQAVIDAVKKLHKLANHSIKTYIVGMGAGVDPNKNPAAAATLKAMAIAGGTSNYFPGTSAAAVVQDMQAIFGQIQAANMSTASVAVNTGSINSNTLVFQARFTSKTSPYNGWTGNLLAFPVSVNNGNVAVNTAASNAQWQAATTLDAALSGTGWSSFPFFTWNPTSTAGASFQWSGIDTAQQTDLEQYWGSLTSAQQTNFSNSQSDYGKAVLDYLRGDTSQDQANDGMFRNRSSLLGDIVDSNPIYVGNPPAYDGLSAPPGASSATQSLYTQAATAYASFLNATASRTKAVYAGTNGGMLYGFDASSGTPLFGYVPVGVYHDLANLSKPDYNANHRFYVDGSPSVADVPFISSGGGTPTVSWHTVLAGGLDAGGKGIYALDVTNPSSFASADVLWDITSNTPGFSQLGLTYSQPQIAVMNINDSNNVPVPTPVVIFGNGYNSASSMPYLYVVNAQTGTLIHTFNLCSPSTGIEPSACNPNMPDGLSTPAVLSTQGDGVADRAYAGDLQGNLWRFDMSSPDPANWTARVLFQARGPNDKRQPITTAPAVSRAPYGTSGYLVFFGTGQFLGTPDMTNTNTQSFYGVLDNGTNSSLPVGGSNGPFWVTRSQLVAQTLSQATYTGVDSQGNTVTKTVRTATSNAVNYASKDGWYMDLPGTGERVLSSPRVFGGEVVFTSNVPATNVCGGGIESWLMAVNFSTGGAFAAPMLDLNGDGQINAGDQVSGKNPVGVNLGIVYASAPVVSPIGGQSVKLVSASNTKIIPQRERAGLLSGRETWVELR